MSVAVTVKLNVFATVGVPLSKPAVESVIPVGIAPALTPNVLAPVPPVFVIDCEYPLLFTVQFGSVAGLTTIAALITTV